MDANTSTGAPRYLRLFWDLDGTLTDSREGMVRSVAFALESVGREVDEATLDRFIGPPVVWSFRTFYGLEGEELARAIERYRHRYLRQGWRENRLVPGIEPLLGALRDAGVSMAVATVKPRPAAERILAHLGLGGYFDALYAPGAYGLEADKEDVLGEALGGRVWQGPGGAAMIGDHEGDIRAARVWGLDGIAVLYGYGDPEALRAAKPAAVAADVRELGSLLFA